MISCAFALILHYMNPNKNKNNDSTRHPFDLERLAILGSDGGRSYYAAYDNPSPGKFPVPDTKYNLAMTIKNNVSHGTNIKAYCSNTMSSVEIAEILESVVSSETVDYQDLVPADPRYDTCFAYIENLADIQNAKYNDEHNQSPLSATTLCQNKQCSNGDLLNLAFRGKILVSGTFSYLAPINQKALLKVAMDQPVYFEKLVGSSHIHGFSTKKELREILIWYFGHLHIFRRKSDSPIWTPVTQLGSEYRNGALILNYIRRKTDLLTELDQITRKSGASGMLRDCLRGSVTCDTHKETNIRTIMAHISSVELYRQYCFDCS
ncbi:unnamed protein product [Blumeria hordei]|uniref:Uncharacterized protein n=1 Tax=Blumeria hordei TaxID=2867405 RepID=A0A383UNV5_BLUHO|nr:unnamed protein product [Blumeria hordei]